MSIEYKAQAGQENFRLILKTEINFETYVPSAQIIKYKKDGVSLATELTAVILTGSESDGKIYYDFSVATPVPANGHYRTQALLTIDGKEVPCRSADWYVGENL